MCGRVENILELGQHLLGFEVSFKCLSILCIYTRFSVVLVFEPHKNGPYKLSFIYY